MDARRKCAPQSRRSAYEGITDRPMDHRTLRAITRRHFFKQSGFGIGGVACPALLDERLLARQVEGPFVPRAPHFAPKAKQIIYLFMAGAPTQLDLFDNKPALQKYDGQEIPAEFVPKGERFAFIKGTPRLLGSPFAFKRYGQSGAELSELLPELATIADDIAIVPWCTPRNSTMRPARSS